MTGQQDKRPGMREGGSAHGCQKQPEIAILQGGWDPKTDSLMLSGYWTDTFHGRQKRVETP